MGYVEISTAFLKSLEAEHKTLSANYARSLPQSPRAESKAG